MCIRDSSFSALDYRTDAKLREGLSKQLHDTTKIIVAQRISTIRHADKIVVLDEPTSGLDYRECMTVMETVRTMAERGCAVIMVCHDMEVVSDFAERIVVMADGRILDRGRTHELFSNIDLMRRAYVEPPQVIELSRRLASSVSPAFAQVSEVTDVVRITKEMVHRG